MKNLMLSMVLLTALDGSPVWVESTAVQVIRGTHTECKHGNGALVRMSSASICVRETPEKIKEIVRNADRN